MKLRMIGKRSISCSKSESKFVAPNGDRRFKKMTYQQISQLTQSVGDYLSDFFSSSDFLHRDLGSGYQGKGGLGGLPPG